MNVLAAVRRRLPMRLVVMLGVAAAVIATFAIGRALDLDAVRDAVAAAAGDPAGVAVALAAFAAAFVVRAVAWQLVLPRLSFGHSLAAIHLALGGNHVLPFRLGEPLRVLSVTRRADIALDAATASTITLRSADLLAMITLGAIAAPAAFFELVGPVTIVVVAGFAGVATLGWRWLRSIATRAVDVDLPGLRALGLSAGAWLLEAVLVHRTAVWAGLDVSWWDAVLVTTVAVAAQIIAIAPGGLGTYEAAAVAAWVVLGHDADLALVAALAAHALKTAYSIAAGGLAVVRPAPSLIGRLRLAPRADGAPSPPNHTEDSAPVLLFMPAFNEEAAVASCVRRAPSTVAGLPVEVVVVDDGSTDATAACAAAAGAEVVRLGENRGLGAAVRCGFALGVERGASAVVFCDADGEYPPEELEALVEPILAGRADYVVGSRFLGDILHMRPHRRCGNVVLTRILSVIARRRITDGQSGYRALSPTAVADAEIIHDFNYAQVLTLDLLAKGYRYEEVPISYHFRTTGESFVKLGRYLRSVVPAVYRELNTA